MKYYQKGISYLLSKAGNILFMGVLLLLLFNPSAKAWLLQQLLEIGLFNAEIKKEAPVPTTASFSFRDEKGAVRSTADLKGKVVFLNFWATWCPPCRAEMPALNDLYKTFGGDNRIVFLFLNEEEDPAKAIAYLRKNGYAMPFAAAAGRVPPELYSGTLPTTVVLNKEGNIVFRHEGVARYNTTAFYEELRALL